MVDDASAKLADLEGQMKSAQAEVKISQTVVNEVKNGNFLDHNRFISDFPRLNINNKNAQQRVELTLQKIKTIEELFRQKKQEVEILEKRKNDLEHQGKNTDKHIGDHLSTIYKAPISGIILKIPKSLGNKIKRNETLVLLQLESEQPIIEAYLTQAQVEHVEIGSQATALIPKLDNSYQAKVIQIDRTGGVPDEVKRQYQLLGSPDQSAYIKLQITEIKSEDKSKLTVGTPIILQIPKKIYILKKFSF